MAKVIFTKEEIEALKSNQYVIRTSEKSIQFSQAFKGIEQTGDLGHRAKMQRQVFQSICALQTVNLLARDFRQDDADCEDTQKPFAPRGIQINIIING